MTEHEHVYCAVEIHSDPSGPGRLTGTIATFGETSRDSRRHVFEAGSLKWDPAGVTLNRQHVRGSPIARITPTVDGDRIVVDHALPGYRRRPRCRVGDPRRTHDRTFGRGEDRPGHARRRPETYPGGPS